MKNHAAVATVLAILLVGTPLFAEEPRKMELRMQPGESVNYALHVDMRTDYTRQSSRGPEQRTLLFTSDMKVLIRCTQVSEDGVIHVEITYPDFTMQTSITEQGGTSRIISDRDGARSYADGKLQESITWEALEKQGRPNLRKLFGSIITFSVDRRGKVLDVQFPPGLAERFPGVDTKQFFRQQIVFPEVAITPGTEWNETSEREAPRGPGPLDGKIMIDEAVYQYQRNEKAFERDCARIEILVKSRPKEKIPNLTEFKQTNEGWALADLRSGQLVQSQMKIAQEMRGTPGGIKTEVRTTGEIRTSLVEPAAARPPPTETPPQKAPTETKSGVQ